MQGNLVAERASKATMIRAEFDEASASVIAKISDDDGTASDNWIADAGFHELEETILSQFNDETKGHHPTPSTSSNPSVYPSLPKKLLPEPAESLSMAKAKAYPVGSGSLSKTTHTKVLPETPRSNPSPKINKASVKATPVKTNRKRGRPRSVVSKPSTTPQNNKSKRELTNMKRWMEMYKRLLDYKKEYGHTSVPQRWKLDTKLGAWVDVQRRKCNAPEKVKLLSSIGFEWKVRDMTERKQAWTKMYQRLLEFLEKHGHTRVGVRYKEDRKLGMWVQNQRRCCKKPERIKLLNDINFEWRVQSPRKKSITNKTKAEGSDDESLASPKSSTYDVYNFDQDAMPIDDAHGHQIDMDDDDDDDKTIPLVDDKPIPLESIMPLTTFDGPSFDSEAVHELKLTGDHTLNQKRDPSLVSLESTLEIVREVVREVSVQPEEEQEALLQVPDGMEEEFKHLEFLDVSPYL